MIKVRDITRRTVVMAAPIGAVALWGASTAADATDPSGDAFVVAEDIMIDVPGASLPGYCARPRNSGTAPVIVVIEGIFGIQPFIKDVCRRLAGLGYLAVAPELYARQADLSKMTDPVAIMQTVILKAPDSLLLSDLGGTIDWATAHSGDKTRIGTIGFGRGGRDAWLFAAHDRRLRAAVAFYGPVGGTTNAVQPHTPIHYAKSLKCPLLGVYGGADPYIPQADVFAAQARAHDAGKIVEIVYFPDAGPRFYDSAAPTYNRIDAEQAWDRTITWLRQFGVS
jgi:carboxymethylenebutenolidase